jgi:hypothetical protein
VRIRRDMEREAVEESAPAQRGRGTARSAVEGALNTA